MTLAGSAGAEVQRFNGASDASAAIALGEGLIWVADDENNRLRCYSTATGGAPLATLDLTESLGVDRRYPEVDIEGAARVGDRIYWISSHGRNKKGKPRSSRHCFFGTRIVGSDRHMTLQPPDRVYTTLLEDILASAQAEGLGLDRAIGKIASDRQRLAPKREGLNIEGLCASADGRILFIGFRNPRPQGHALILPLINPAEVIDRGHRARLGRPLLWDLKGLGIRAMSFSPYHRAFFLVAGPHDGKQRFALYRWSGDPDAPPQPVRALDGLAAEFTPEALVPFEGSDRLYLLSDDGARLISVSGPHECLPGQWLAGGKAQNKHLLDANRKTFRGTWLTVH